MIEIGRCHLRDYFFGFLMKTLSSLFFNIVDVSLNSYIFFYDLNVKGAVDVDSL